VITLSDSFQQMWQMGGSIRDDYVPRNFMTTYDGVPEERPDQWPCLGGRRLAV